MRGQRQQPALALGHDDELLNSHVAVVDGALAAADEAKKALLGDTDVGGRRRAAMESFLLLNRPANLNRVWMSPTSTYGIDVVNISQVQRISS